ncbi:MAG: glycosyltransferase, partial [Chloroflexi bacterium]|nr:glycosyltransferase [Chloroflexota bacterium]
VVNDGGERSLTAVSTTHKTTLPLTLLTIPNGGPAAARNAGSKAATCDYLAFTDDDCRVTPDWLTKLAQGFSQTNCDAIAGATLNPQPGRVGMDASQFLIDFMYQFMQDRAGNGLLLVSNNVAYRRTVFESVNGFNDSFPLAAAEDMELSQRMVKKGYWQRFYPDAQVWHHHQLSAWGHVAQQFRYGRGGHYFLQMQQSGTDMPAPKGNFNRALLRALWHSNLGWQARMITLVGQVAYRAGIWYERLVGGK